MSLSRITGLLTLLLVLLATGNSSAVAPAETLDLQLSAVDAAGEPITGPQTVTVRVWDAALGGTLLYEELHVGLAPAEGVIHLSLGSGIPTAGGSFTDFSSEIFAPLARYVELGINAETMTERVLLTRAAHSLYADLAQDSDALGEVPAGDFQLRVDGSCPPGQAMRSIAADGQLIRAADLEIQSFGDLWFPIQVKLDEVSVTYERDVVPTIRLDLCCPEMYANLESPSLLSICPRD